MAPFLFCSRASVYRSVRADRAGSLGIRTAADGQLSIAVPSPIFRPWLTRSLGAILHKAPRAYGWCRTRWRGATLTATLQATSGLQGSAETVRRWLHALHWVWTRATRVAKDDDPYRIARLARLRFPAENLPAHARMVCADALAIHLLPKGGAAWMPQGTQEEGLTPGKKAKHSRAGALQLATGTGLYGRGPRKNNGVLRALVTLLATTSPARQMTRSDGVVDNSGIHKAQAVEQWLAAHPRFALRWLPPYCPRANPMARVFGEVHDKCTRNPKRKRLRDLVQDVERPMEEHGPWKYKRSQLYETPEVTAVVEHIAAERQAKIAA